MLVSFSVQVISFKKMNSILVLSAITSVVFCNASDILTTSPPPPQPYAFGYAAGRFPGHIDRTHSEVSDGSGVVQGSYSYVDPKYQIRTVDYTADKNGFHPVLNFSPPPLPKDSAAVAAAKERHLQQYNAIAYSHQVAPGQVVVPAQSAAVQRETAKHFALYQRIAAEHARLATAEKIQAPEVPNYIEEH